MSDIILFSILYNVLFSKTYESITLVILVLYEIKFTKRFNETRRPGAYSAEFFPISIADGISVVIV